MIDLAYIQQAAKRLEGVVRHTPMLHSHTLTERLGCEVYLKLENLQIAGAFKLRGATNCIAQLSADERRRGVITASAGNHAQGVAAAAQAAGIGAVIVMPENTPVAKVQATADYGAEVILHGESFDQAQSEAWRIADESGAVFVHPFDDDRVIAGQGTIGLEIFEQLPEVGCVIVPVGGGGLISGIATAVQSLKPAVTVIGVQAENAPAMYTSCRVEELTPVEVTGTLAEGIAVGEPCARTFEIIRRRVERLVTVSERDIARAMLELIERHKLVAEGAGATPVAALEECHEEFRGRTVCLVISGGNADVTTLNNVIDRGLVEAGRTVKLQVTLPDRPGALAHLAAAIAEAGANIVEVHHDRMSVSLELGQAEVEVVLGARGHDHITAIIAHLCEAGYDVRRID
ncbi:MAG: threonine ammonia-lyase [Armatimonadetes bacterium]|nr:threonine ammonia-lyase [Armatimonadota bacterium]